MTVLQQRRVRSRYRRVLLLFAGLLVAGGIAVAVDRLGVLRSERTRPVRFLRRIAGAAPCY